MDGLGGLEDGVFKSTFMIGSQNPEVKSLQPIKGPRSGSTHVTISGENLDFGSVVEVKVDQEAAFVIRCVLWWFVVIPHCYHTTPHGTTLHRTTPHHTAPHHTTPHYTAPNLTTPHHTTPHHTAPHHTTPHRTTPHHTAPHHTTPHLTTPQHTTTHHTTPHHNTPHHTTPHRTAPQSRQQLHPLFDSATQQVFSGSRECGGGRGVVG